MMRAWHCPCSGTLHIKTGRVDDPWFHLTVFAAPSHGGMESCLEISIKFFWFYRVFHFPTEPLAEFQSKTYN